MRHRAVNQEVKSKTPISPPIFSLFQFFTDSNVKLIAAIMRLSLFSSKQCIIKQLLDSVFVTSGIIKVSLSVIRLSLQLRLITLTSILIIPDITETSSNKLFIV